MFTKKHFPPKTFFSQKKNFFIISTKKIHKRKKKFHKKTFFTRKIMFTSKKCSPKKITKRFFHNFFWQKYVFTTKFNYLNCDHTQIVRKLKNKIVTKLKKIKLWPIKTQIMTLLKTQIVKKLKKTQIVTKCLYSSCEKTQNLKMWQNWNSTNTKKNSNSANTKKIQWW